ARTSAAGRERRSAPEASPAPRRCIGRSAVAACQLRRGSRIRIGEVALNSWKVWTSGIGTVATALSPPRSQRAGRIALPLKLPWSQPTRRPDLSRYRTADTLDCLPTAAAERHRSCSRDDSTRKNRVVAAAARRSGLQGGFRMTDHALVRDAAVRSIAVNPRRILLAAMAAVFAILALTGGLRPSLTPDTPGYLSPWTWSELWGGRRTPFLGFLLAPFGDDFSLYPTLIVGLFFAAAYYLFGSLVRFGVSERAALALTLPLLVSNSLVRYASDVHAEFPSIVLLLYALAELLRLAADARPRPWRYAAFCAAL